MKFGSDHGGLDGSRTLGSQYDLSLGREVPTHPCAEAAYDPADAANLTEALGTSAFPGLGCLVPDGSCDYANSLGGASRQPSFEPDPVPDRTSEPTAQIPGEVPVDPGAMADIGGGADLPPPKPPDVPTPSPFGEYPEKLPRGVIHRDMRVIRTGEGLPTVHQTVFDIERFAHEPEPSAGEAAEIAHDFTTALEAVHTQNRDYALDPEGNVFVRRHDADGIASYLVQGTMVMLTHAPYGTNPDDNLTYNYYRDPRTGAIHRYSFVESMSGHATSTDEKAKIAAPKDA